MQMQLATHPPMRALANKGKPETAQELTTEVNKHLRSVAESGAEKLEKGLKSHSLNRFKIRRTSIVFPV